MSFDEARAKMVTQQLRSRGIADPRVLQAFAEVPREEFVEAAGRPSAYDDTALRIAEGQTISQPYIVALTAEAMALQGSERVLEVGTGSGYAAAILSRLAREVYSVERIPSLAEGAATRLKALGCENVWVDCRDGSLGWAAHAPYDAIAVAAAGPKVPPALLSQLRMGGRLVMPVGSETDQVLTRVVKTQEGFRSEPITGVRFVPLIGAQGWSLK